MRSPPSRVVLLSAVHEVIMYLQPDSFSPIQRNTGTMIGIDAAIMMTYCSMLENASAYEPNPQAGDSPCPDHQPRCSIYCIISATDERQRNRSMKPTRVIGFCCQRFYLHHFYSCSDHGTAACEKILQRKRAEQMLTRYRGPLPISSQSSFAFPC